MRGSNSAEGVTEDDWREVQRPEAQFQDARIEWLCDAAGSQ